MNEKVRVGIVGASEWAERLHITGLDAHPKASLVAICARTRVNSQDLAGKYGTPDIYTD